MMKAPEGMPQGDPKYTRRATLCLIIWLIGLLIIIMSDSHNAFIKVFNYVWMAYTFIIVVYIIGIFLCILIGIILYQLYSRFPNAYEKLPNWIKRLSDKYIL